ncbi:MAG: hypothetical protein M3M87_04715 [Thermoproteota archaeon]|nr:hypothetical protein [Thermoproteota archaeon]
MLYVEELVLSETGVIAAAFILFLSSFSSSSSTAAAEPLLSEKEAEALTSK